jgi:signal peptidase I
MAKSSKRAREGDEKQASRQVVPAPAAKEAKAAWSSWAIFRELVEAVAIAFVLAFLFRTFEAEAFVIPTGSMATTLMGRHKDVECRMCHYRFQVGDSSGTDSATGQVSSDHEAVAGTCPMCRYENNINGDTAFNGDRILVNKFVYGFDDPKRWDVTVFKYPEGAKTNFIKRMVGLPGETIRISRGDLFVRKGDEPFRMARKPAEKLLAMLQPVFDNDYELAGKLVAQGWPARWQAEAGAGGWAASEDHKSFSIAGSAGGEAWLRYRHFVPDWSAWQAVDRGTLAYAPQPQLITDFCSYNSGVEGLNYQGQSRAAGLHWVGDLAVECALEVRGREGTVVLELVEGGRRMQCRIDTATGRAELGISDTEFRVGGATPVVGPGRYDIMFANVDDELRLWVNGNLIAFDAPTTYESLGNLGNTVPREADLAPVGIASLGADVAVRHLKVLRDVYYVTCQGQHYIAYEIATPAGLMRQPAGVVICDYLRTDYFGEFTPASVQKFFSEPMRWPELFTDQNMPARDFPLREDQFLMLGDNSPQSKDSRLWTGAEYYVERELLIGKALFVYWPHSWHAVWLGRNTRIPFPFFPNVKRMGFVR